MELENEENIESDKAASAQKMEVAPAVEPVSEDDFPSELHAPRWSVISFEKREASNLTYSEAAEKLEELAAKNISGLCIITDQAARRI